MNKKMVGIVLMSSALLLQVGYAVSITTPHAVVNTQAFDVYFVDSTVTEVDEYMTIEVTEGTHPNEGALYVSVGNLYPGAQFKVTTGIENKGLVDAKVTGVDIRVKEGLEEGSSKTYNKMLLDKLVGYDEGGNSYKGEEAYEKYLIEAYEGEVIESGVGIPIRFSMGLDYEEEGFQNEEVAFSIQMTFGQVIDTSPGEGDNEGGSGSEGEGDNEGDSRSEGEGDNEGGSGSEGEGDNEGGSGSEGEGDDEGDSGSEGDDNTEVTIPEEAIPGGGAIMSGSSSESQPGGTTNQEGGTIPPNEDVQVSEGGSDSDIEVPDEIIPGGAVLPKTGGVTPVFVYGLGALMMIIGAVCYGKKDDKNKVEKITQK